MNAVIFDFVKAWNVAFEVEHTLTLGDPDHCIFGEMNLSKDISLKSIEKGIPIDDTFDLILGCFPLGLNPDRWEFNGQTVKAPRNWLYLLRSAAFLNPTGYGIFLIEPSALAQPQWEGIEQELNREGLHIHGVLSAPEKLFDTQTSIIPILVVLARAPSSEIFVAELLGEGQASNVVTNFARNKPHGTLSEGLFMPREDFTTFKKLKIRQQIDRLETQYKDYERHSLRELAHEIIAIRSGGSHVDRENAVYIPKIGNSPVICSLQDAKLKHHNYFQVVLKKEAKCEYVTSFFRSNLGRLVLSSLTTESFIPHLNKRDIDNAMIALPSLDDQERIVSTLSKLNELQSELSQLESELALNPTNSKAVVGKLDSMMESIGALTLADKIRSLVRTGESKTLEFKETLSLDVNKKTKEDYLQISALKTIVAFLNTDGGVLLVGVRDNGSIPGLSREIEKFHKNISDNFLLHLKNLLRSKIGEQFYPYFEYDLADVDGAQVLHVQCRPADGPCFLDKKDFYVRTNPATDKLEGPKLVEYVKAHFKK